LQKVTARRPAPLKPRIPEEDSYDRGNHETGEAFQVAAEVRAFLHGRGIEISGEQETKTRKALEYFAGAVN
jgi:hypothetical protein